jgi:hypothetical protein
VVKKWRCGDVEMKLFTCLCEEITDKEDKNHRGRRNFPIRCVSGVTENEI